MLRHHGYFRTKLNEISIFFPKKNFYKKSKKNGKLENFAQFLSKMTTT